MNKNNTSYFLQKS